MIIITSVEESGRSGVLTYFQVQRAGEGFQVAGSADREAERLNVLFALPL